MASIFGDVQNPKAPPPAPTVTPPARMPDPDDPAIVEAKRKAVTDALGRGGRASTILTGAKPSPSAYDTFTSKSLGA